MSNQLSLFHGEAAKQRQNWEYREGRATAWSVQPIAQYVVEEQVNKRKVATFRAAVCSEVGWHEFNRTFRTLAAAQRFCEDNVDQWRAQIAEFSKQLCRA
jgi:hypothetical protein